MQILHPECTIHIIIDVFRAFSTACTVLSKKPKSYALTNHCTSITQRLSVQNNCILIGKPEKGSAINYHAPNSPNLVANLDLKEKHIYHRTSAGATGVMQSNPNNIVLCTSLNNLPATATYVSQFKNHPVIIQPMGHEANTPSIEDNICASLLRRMISGSHSMEKLPIDQIRASSGQYFFQQNPEYPEEDFHTCLQIGTHPFAIKADIKEGYALLTEVNV